jgi:hypothetical protein
MLGLLTIGLLIGAANLAARWTFHGEAPFVCLVPGPNWAAGDSARPNTICRDKSYEGNWIEYKFNSCGHRAGMECGTKPPGTYRIVIIGSSAAMGHRVEQEKTFAPLLAAELSRRTGRRVEVYDEGLVTVFPGQMVQRFREALAAEPDLVLWVITPTDVQRVLAPDNAPVTQNNGLDLLRRAKFRMNADFSGKSFKDGVEGYAGDLFDRGLQKFDGSAVGTLLLHVIYKSQSQYVKSVLVGGDEQGFLRRKLSPKWQLRLQYFADDFANIERQASAAHVPVATVLVPSRGEAALLSLGGWPKEDDPYALNNDLRSIITGDGGIYIDILGDHRWVSHAERLYYPVDGHPNEAGHAAIATMLANALNNSSIPLL